MTGLSARSLKKDGRAPLFAPVSGAPSVRRKPKVLLVHNFYQHPGGEDRVLSSEKRLLTAAGHEVVEFLRHNGEIMQPSPMQAALLGVRTIWSPGTREELLALIKRERPAVAHCHNTLPLLSPSVYSACCDAGVPVVQTIHNYRLLCPSAVLYRDGRICEDCLGKTSAWPAVIHRCYRNSCASSAAVATMLAVHRALGTWKEAVDCYIAPSEFARTKLIQGGLPADKIAVKPHFVPCDPGPRAGQGEFALYVGRLSPEKGLETLVKAWRQLASAVPLVVVGDGPLRQHCEALGKAVTCTGYLEEAALLAYMRRARFVVVPSECYETFGLAIIEAFACGVPVVAPCLGALAELVQNGRTGLHYQAGSAEDLAAKAEWAWSHPEQIKQMGFLGHLEYKTKYTAERNYQLLMQIYANVLAKHEGLDRKQRRIDDEKLAQVELRNATSV